MNGTDIQEYEYALKKADELGLKCSASGEAIKLCFVKSGLGLGRFESVKHLFSFLCGYEWGIREK